MNNYSIALLLHIVGAVGFFVALGLEWTGLSQIRRTMSLEQVRAWMGILKNVRNVGFVSMLTTVITGIYMMMTTWGGAAWLYVTLGSLVIMIAMAQEPNRTRSKAREIVMSEFLSSTKISRRDFVSAVIISIGALMGVVISIPAVGYLIGPALKVKKSEAWVPLGPLVDYPIGKPTYFSFTRSQVNGWEKAI